MQNTYNINTRKVIFMSEQVLIQFRADKELKQEVSEIYDALGLDLPTAFRMFMSRSKLVRGLPFDATLPESEIIRARGGNAFASLREQAASLPDFSLDEINDEIRAARKSGTE